MKKLLTLLSLSFLLMIPVVQASESVHDMPKLYWSFDGPFGTYDRGALQRGFQVYSQVCSSCHSMKYISYRNLSALGYNEAEIKAIAAEYTTMDGPDDEGEMFERSMKPSDKLKSPFENDAAARYANNGALPPDLSLIVKARAGGADYIFSILTGYEDVPAGETLSDGQYWNKQMAGHKIAMAPPLSAESVEYSDGTGMTVEQYARDVSHFLAWAASPEMEVRKRTGIKVLLYLFLFAGLMYAVKKKIWADVKKH